MEDSLGLAGANIVITTYGYDPAGNLTSVAYPNNVTTTYSYNLLNRLTKLASTTPASAVASYQYTLAPAGNRTSVTELSGRSVQYGYDDLYRLTSETIAHATAQNGAIGYTYDSVGNRQQITSTVNAIPSSGTLLYDANDRTLTDTYDNDGNTMASGGIQNTYDFENHLVQHGAVNIVYDGDGNRVSETAAGVTTNYQVDSLNPTGYAQVFDELQNGTVTRSYGYGLQLIDEGQLVAGSWQLSYYGFDGHGSVRYLTNPQGVVTDTYDYDAFGNLIASTGSTPNNHLFAGEQWDPNLNLYYNRARYLDVRSGRFWSMDTADGEDEDPVSLHRYLYAGSDPVGRIDPSGRDSLLESIGNLSIQIGLAVQSSPILTSVVVGTALALAPEDLQNAFAIAFPAGELIPTATEEIRELSVIRRAYQYSGKARAGTDFGIFMASLLKDSEKEIVVLEGKVQTDVGRPLGSAVVDALYRGIVFEFKTSIGAALRKTNQIEQLAKFASTQPTKVLTYIFLNKPSPQEIERLAQLAHEGASDVRLAIGYLF